MLRCLTLRVLELSEAARIIEDRRKTYRRAETRLLVTERRERAAPERDL
jgi:hypothetical protein